MIDEKKLIEEIQDAINCDRYEGYKPAAVLFEMWDIIKDQPKVGEWIPCSERLPGEEAEQYIRDVYNGKGSLYPCLVTYQIPNHKRICIGEFYYDIDEKCFINHEGREEIYCLAWQPLPEPWEGEAAAESQKEEE